MVTDWFPTGDRALSASEITAEHVGRRIQFDIGGEPVEGVISKVDSEWSTRVLVELNGTLDQLYNLAPASEVLIKGDGRADQ